MNYKATLLVVVSLLMGCCAKTRCEGSTKNATNEISLYCLASSEFAIPYYNTLISSMFEGLVRREGENKVALAMAESVNISDDGTVYTFTLRPAQWSDGLEVSAEDFVERWKRVYATQDPFVFSWIKKVPSSASIWSSGKTLAVKALDPKTVEITLESRTPYFLELLTDSSFAPRCRGEIGTKEDPFRGPYNGPFVLGNNSFTELVLEKNPFYWDPALPQTDVIRLRKIASLERARSDFATGALDWLGAPFSRLTEEDIRSAAKNGVVINKVCDESVWLICDIDLPCLRSAKIRKAIALAINRSALCQSYPSLFEHFVPALTVSMEPQCPEQFIEDNAPQKAKQLFDEGLAELQLTKETYPPLVLMVLCPNEEQSFVAKVLREQLEKTLGVHIILKQEAPAVKEKPALLLCVTRPVPFHDPITPYLFLRSAFPSISIFQAGVEWMHGVGGHGLVAEEMMEKYAMENLPVIPICRKQCVYLKRKNVSGDVVNSDGSLDLKYLHKE